MALIKSCVVYGDHYLTACCHCTVILVHGLVRFCVCRLASVVWLLSGGCYALTSLIVCVGVMDTCGRLKTGVGGGLWLWGFKSVSKILLGKIVVSSFRWLLLVYSAEMYNHSIVFKCAPLFCSCNTCIVLWMGPKECVCSMRCLAKL